jgi:hypothetical protein
MIIFKYFTLILPTVIFDQVICFTDPKFINSEALNIEDFLIPPRLYNKDDSKCESNAECEDSAREACRGNGLCLKEVEREIKLEDPEYEHTKLTKCGLVEVY